MLKLTLGECRNQVRYYKYIAYTFWEHFFPPYYSPRYWPSTSEDSSLPPSWTNCLQLSELWEYVSGSTALPPKMSFFPPLIRWPLSVTFLHSMFCPVSIQTFSELGSLASLQMKISTASVSRSSRPLKGFSFLGAVLSTGEGGGKW